MRVPDIITIPPLRVALTDVPRRSAIPSKTTSFSSSDEGLMTALRKRDCVTSTLYGGQVPITTVVCHGGRTVCSVCEGCEAPVTVCREE